jgi:hypothetical protein
VRRPRLLDRTAEHAIITTPERKPQSGRPLGITKQFEVRARRARRAPGAVLLYGEEARPSSNDALARNAPVILAPVAQLDRARASGARGHRFESCRAHWWKWRKHWGFTGFRWSPFVLGVYVSLHVRGEIWRVFRAPTKRATPWTAPNGDLALSGVRWSDPTNTTGHGHDPAQNAFYAGSRGDFPVGAN